jgi:hypothetical protein
MESNSIPCGFQWGHIHPWIPWNIPGGFHGTIHMDSVEIPWNKAPFLWETALSKIMSPFRIEHSTPQEDHMGTLKEILLLNRPQ